MAQLVEQRIRNAWVRGSSPRIGSMTNADFSPIECLRFFIKQRNAYDEEPEANPHVELCQPRCSCGRGSLAGLA